MKIRLVSLILLSMACFQLETASRRKASLDKAPKEKPNLPPRPKKLIKDMDFEEASAAKEYYEKTHEPELVTKSLERMLLTNSNPHQLKQARLELAKNYEKQGKAEKSLKLYKEFIQLYPGTQECQEALYKSIKLSFSLTNDYKHDQAKTHEAIELAKDFLEKEKNYQLYKDEVENIMSACYEKLCDHDLYVCNQYLTLFSYSENDKDFKAARHRFNHCKKKYLPYAPGKTAELQALEKKLENLDPAQPTEIQSNDTAQKPDLLSRF